MKLTWVGSLLVTLVFATVSAAQDLGPHNINGQGCLSCHTSDTPDPSSIGASFNFGTFSDQDPSSHSAVCLACHDGKMAPAGSALSHDHPVNVPYLLGKDGHWPGVVTSNGVQFTPSNFDFVYGRPIRFYVSSGTPYVECASCHDPHSYSVAIVTINGQVFNKPTKQFVRGWYSEMPGSNSVSQFCRSCHYEQSAEFSGLLVGTM